jgi:hypothetical protein
MKKDNFLMTLLAAVFFLSTTELDAQVGIGTNSPNAQAVLDVSSTSKAFILPRLSTSQRDLSITSPVAGMLIYNTTTSKFQGYTVLPATVASNSSTGADTYVSYEEYPAQTFQVSASTTSFSISFWVDNLYNGFLSGNVTFELYQGTPGGSTTMLNTQTTSVTSTGQKTLTVSGVSLSTGITYFFLVKPTTTFATGWFSLTRSGTGGNPYANGAIYIYSNQPMMGWSWSSAYNDDLRFEVFDLSGWVDLH